jgi:hypothetical protein
MQCMNLDYQAPAILQVACHYASKCQLLIKIKLLHEAIDTEVLQVTCNNASSFTLD